MKTKKTAGTSVEIILSTWCSGRDVVTPFSPVDEETRARMGGRPMNFRGLFGRKKFHNHMPAEEVRRKLPSLWKKAFKFSIERHPYERVISRAHWWMHRYQRNDLQAEIENVLSSPGWVSNRKIYCIDDQIAVDEVILYDNLWPRLAELAKQWGRDMPAEIPRAKGSYRRDRRPAQEVLMDAQKERIFEMAREDFEQFGFRR